MATLAELTIRIIEEERAKEVAQAAMELSQARSILTEEQREARLNGTQRRIRKAS